MIDLMLVKSHGAKVWRATAHEVTKVSLKNNKVPSTGSAYVASRFPGHGCCFILGPTQLGKIP